MIVKVNDIPTPDMARFLTLLWTFEIGQVVQVEFISGEENLTTAITLTERPWDITMLSPFANPGLASAGTGDVLAGTITGLLSQGMTLEDAAALGVYVHGAAGERVRDGLGDTGMIASDLLPELPRVIKRLRARA